MRFWMEGKYFDEKSIIHNQHTGSLQGAFF